MNKKSEDNSVTPSPIDKKEITYSFQKETKKLTRLPYYKLEELKKQEEKKLKNPHKIKKKEDSSHHHTFTSSSQHAGKTAKKKTILKKIKEEKYNDDESNRNKEESTVHKSQGEKMITHNLQSENKKGDGLKLLKYSVNEVKSKNSRLSKKQKKLQEAENTIGSFLSKEDKNILYTNNNDDSHNFIKHKNSVHNRSSSLNVSSQNGQMTNSMVTSDKNLTSNLHLTSTSNIIHIKKNDNSNNECVLLGKKKKRINKFKKAIYKYRFKKKQFIFNNLFKFDQDTNENKDNEINNLERREDGNFINPIITESNDDKIINPKLIDSNKVLLPAVQFLSDLNLQKTNSENKEDYVKQNYEIHSNIENPVSENDIKKITNDNIVFAKQEINFNKTLENITPKTEDGNTPRPEISLDKLNQKINDTNISKSYLSEKPVISLDKIKQITNSSGHNSTSAQPTNTNNFPNLNNSTLHPNNIYPNNNLYQYYNTIGYPSTNYMMNSPYNFYNNFQSNKFNLNNGNSYTPVYPYMNNYYLNHYPNYAYNQMAEPSNYIHNNYMNYTNYPPSNTSNPKQNQIQNKQKANKFPFNQNLTKGDKQNPNMHKQVSNTNNTKHLINQNPPSNDKKGFIFESVNSNNKNEIKSDEFKKHLAEEYKIDKDLTKLDVTEFNQYISQSSEFKRINIKNLQKVADQNLISQYIEQFEGVQPDSNINKKIIREYVDQILDSEFDKKFSDFVVKMREIYFKKKLTNPLKAKRRFVVGMREIEKFIRLDEVKCLFIVPNIEKIEGENSLDERLINIFRDCEKKSIPKFFGLNKFKLGKIARKKHSSVSVLAMINVEGFEREFQDIVELGEKFRKLFYEKYCDAKDCFKDNKFINMNMFEVYKAKHYQV